MKIPNTLFKFLVFIVLLLLPFGGRWLWFYRGKYETPKITPISLAQIPTTTIKSQSFNDQPQPGRGRVVIDLTHDNNLLVDDLTPLQSRLAVRGVKVETFDYNASDSLADRLRSATALVELVPTVPYSTDELKAIVDFVKDGGQLLLAADPTRPVPLLQDSGSIDLYSVLFPVSAIPAVNSLASAFGISFFEDYIYNLTDYNENYRNVIFSTFSKDSNLTTGLDRVTLFAAHSLRGDGQPLITGDENTLSNVRAGETDFVPVLLAEDQKVLALGDITFMTSPYNQVSDNDHFLSNIAEWLATDHRNWDLKDFPFLFARDVDLVQAFSDAVDPRLIAESTPLQQLFSESGIPLGLRAEADPGHDVLYISTYSELDKIQHFLKAADITITFSSTLTTTAETPAGEASQSGHQDTLENTIGINHFGLFNARGSSLYVVSRDGDQLSLIVLAEDEEAIITAIERLLLADFAGCVSYQDITICSTGEIPELPEKAPAEESGGQPADDESAELAKILIVSVDNGSNGARNDASDIETALSGLYDLTVWSIKNQGSPSESDMEGYDAYIVETGDYEYGDEIGKAMDVLSNLDNVLLIGEQPFPTDGEFFKTAPISDLVVVDASHPLAFLFSEGETINLLESESGNPAIVLQKEIFTNTNTSTIVFERGSGSDETGEPAVFASDEGTGQRFVVATFAFYRLPLEKQFNFIYNVVEWLLQ
jgi:hypothetical protein